MHRNTLLPFVAAIVAVSSTGFAQGPPDPAALIAAHREGLAPLSYMDGVWRGPATLKLGPSGETRTFTQTERIGPFLDGSVKVIEARDYDPDGRVWFNAFAIISYDPAKRAYSMRSYAMGNQLDFVITRTADGYIGEDPAMTIRYTATVKDGKWREVGDRIMPGRDLVRFFEMNLVRVGDSNWPGAGAISPK
jgi:hypothetical protein